VRCGPHRRLRRGHPNYRLRRRQTHQRLRRGKLRGNDGKREKGTFLLCHFRKMSKLRYSTMPTE
jgi:hypothetical protein